MRIRTVCFFFAVLLSVQLAWGNGMFMPTKATDTRLYGNLGAVSTEQKGIVIEVAQGRQVLMLQTTYQGPAGEFAWVVPVAGEPRDDDVFIAHERAVERIFRATAPMVRTQIDLPEPPKTERHTWSEGVDALSAGGAGAHGADSVTLHRRMEVGDYDVSVLSATAPGVLVDWLNDHGYATPEDHISIFGHYVRRGWYFVALRVLPEVAEEKPVLDDVRPIGIEFPTDELVYPLHISRASSREKTALTLIALTREPVLCNELTVADLPAGEQGEGTSYARIRREAVERSAGQPAAVLEYAGHGALGNGQLTWRDGEWPPVYDIDLRTLWATRLWTLIDREAMEDLTFAPAEVAGTRVLVERTGSLVKPEDPEAEDGIGGIGGLWLGLLVGMALIVGYGGTRLTAGAGPRRVMRGIALALLMAAAVLAIAQIGGVLPAEAGTVASRHSGLEDLDAGLRALDDAVLAFLEMTGCYPASLEDLTRRRPPALGLDASGNPVELEAHWPGPLLAELPEDPLTERRDTWVYEVTGSPMIDSGGLTISIGDRATIDRPESNMPALPPHPHSLRGGRTLQALAAPTQGRTLYVRRSMSEPLFASPSEQQAFPLSVEDSRRLLVSYTPDLHRAAFARNIDPVAQVRVCDLFPPGLPVEELDREGSWVTGSRDLIDGWWPVSIHDVALHPDGERVAVVARLPGHVIGEMGHQTRVYLMDGVSPPEPVPGTDGCVEIVWEDERTVVGLFAQLPGYPVRGRPVGTLKRVALDGRTEVLAEDAAWRSWELRDGWVATAPRGESVHLLGPGGHSTVIEAPAADLVVDDIFIDEAHLAVAWGPAWPAPAWVPTHQWEDTDVGSVLVYPLGDTAGSEILHYSRKVTRGRTPAVAVVAGRDDDTDAWIVMLAGSTHRARIGVDMTFAAWPDRPPMQLMDHGAGALLTLEEVSLDREDVPAHFVGWLPISELEAGQLVGWYSSSSRWSSASRVVARTLDEVEETGPPVIGQTEFVPAFERAE